MGPADGRRPAVDCQKKMCQVKWKAGSAEHDNSEICEVIIAVLLKIQIFYDVTELTSQKVRLFVIRTLR